MMMMKKKKTTTVSYDVQCVHNRAHVFKKDFEIEEGSESSEETEMDVYCPECQKLVTVAVKGKIPPDKTIYRSIEE